MTNSKWRVIGSKGCGSAIAEATLTLAGLAYERDEVDYGTPGPGRDRLLAANPLGQVPTLVAPDGGVVTESAALVLHVDDLVPGANLLPAVRDPQRRDALRWLVFYVAALYPTFTYGDDPAKWGAGDGLRRATDAHRETLWRQLDGAARGPWFLGARMSALDLYASVMTRWRPGRPWFATNTPRLHAIASTLDRDERLTGVWAANFD